MKISTKGRYALRVMLELALHAGEGYISVKTIAAQQGISDKYLEQIIKMLLNAGLVESVRGKAGGYRLLKEPQDYTVGEILRVTEGSLSPVACVDDAASCERCQSCATYEVWQTIADAINEAVDSITLEQLTEKQKQKNQQ